MKWILPTCFFALASQADAQQRLYASLLWYGTYEIESYDSTPQLRTVPFPTVSLGFYKDIGVRPDTGHIVAIEDGAMGPAGLEFDPDTGVVIGWDPCLYSTGGDYVSAIDSDHGGMLFGQRYASGATSVGLYATLVNPLCFAAFGLSVPANDDGDVAFDRDGALVSTRDGSTALDRIDLGTGAVTPFGDPGIAFAGLEIDTDGSLYGLTAAGALYRFDRSSFQPVLVIQLPAPSPQNPYTGLAFREPAGRFDPTLVCAAQPNSTGQRASIRAAQLPGPAPGAVELQAQGLPPQSFAVLLVSGSTAMQPLGSGVLCLGSGYQRASGAHLSSAAGRTSFLLDLNVVPGHGPVQSGDHLYFQAWFRDASPAGLPTSNLTSAMRIDFLF